MEQGQFFFTVTITPTTTPTTNVTFLIYLVTVAHKAFEIGKALYNNEDKTPFALFLFLLVGKIQQPYDVSQLLLSKLYIALTLHGSGDGCRLPTYRTTYNDTVNGGGDEDEIGRRHYAILTRFRRKKSQIVIVRTEPRRWWNENLTKYKTRRILQ